MAKGKSFKCPECGKVCGSAAGLGKHRSSAHGVAGKSAGTSTGRGRKGSRSAWIIRKTETVTKEVSLEIDLLLEFKKMPKDQLAKLSMAITQELTESDREADKPTIDEVEKGKK